MNDDQIYNLKKCPVCKSDKIFEGTIENSEGGSYSFKPRGLKWWKMLDWVMVHGTFRACAQCGNVWSQLDPLRLTELLARNGLEQTKEKLG